MIAQVLLTLGVPVALVIIAWLGVRLVRWARRKPGDAADALLQVYVESEVADGSLLDDVVDSLGDDP